MQVTWSAHASHGFLVTWLTEGDRAIPITVVLNWTTDLKE
jgi:hypothetical protein